MLNRRLATPTCAEKDLFFDGDLCLNWHHKLGFRRNTIETSLNVSPLRRCVAGTIYKSDSADGKKTRYFLITSTTAKPKKGALPRNYKFKTGVPLQYSEVRLLHKGDERTTIVGDVYELRHSGAIHKTTTVGNTEFTPPVSFKTQLVLGEVVRHVTLHFHKELGEGCNAKTFLYTDQNGTPFVLKVDKIPIKKEFSTQKRDGQGSKIVLQRQISRTDIFAKVLREGVVHVALTPISPLLEFYYTIQPLVKGVELKQYASPMVATESRAFVTSLTKSMAYLKKRGILHRDIQEGNVKVAWKKTVSLTNDTKVEIFSLEAHLVDPDTITQVSQIKSRPDDKHYIPYCPPDFLAKMMAGHYSPKPEDNHAQSWDIWSAGCTMLFATFGKNIFAVAYQMEKDAMAKIVTPLEGLCSKSFSTFMSIFKSDESPHAYEQVTALGLAIMCAKTTEDKIAIIKHLYHAFGATASQTDAELTQTLKKIFPFLSGNKERLNIPLHYEEGQDMHVDMFKVSMV